MNKQATIIFFSSLFLFLQAFFLTAQTLVTSVEAETGIRAGGLTIATTNTGYSGSGYVTNMKTNSDYLTIPVTVPAAGNYKLVIRYNGPNGDKYQDVYVNGIFVSNLSFPATTGYTDLTAGSLSLTAGNNTIGIYNSWGWTDFDKISLYTVPLHDYTRVAAAPIDPAATPEAIALYNYLKSNYGKSIISGQTADYYMNVSPNQAKKPVIRDYDFQHYTVGYPYAWNNATQSHAFGWTDNGATEAAIKWYDSTCQKGIVAFQWHWCSPFGGKAGDNTFSTTLTNFDVTKAVTQGTAEYTAVIRDIDSIATQLKKLQTAGVPVMWRPLHEAGGAWFWWGAKGPATALALYDIMYNRLVHYHGIHNLIWQWSTPEPSWYPGNAKVDMLGYDSYPGAYNYGTQKLIFDQLFDLVNGQKMLAMSENGPIPDPDALFASDAKWSYFMSWDDLTAKQNSPAQLSLVYNHAKVITLDEVTVATNVAKLTATGPTSVCTGGSVLLQANVAKGYTYKWYNGLNLIGSATSSSFTATVSGSYTVVVTTTGLCTTTSAPIVVTIGGPTAVITMGQNIACQGINVLLTASAGESYKWMLNGTVINDATSSTFNASSTGQYTVEITSASNCKSISAPVSIPVESLIATSITPSGTIAICNGGTVLLTASAGSAFKWMLDGTEISNATNATFTASAVGVYTVEITSGPNKCKAISTPTTVRLDPSPILLINTAGSTTICPGLSVALSVSAGVPGPYQWLRNGTAISGQTNSTYAASAAGSYTVLVKSAANCNITSTAVIVAIANTVTWYADADGDGKGDANTSMQSCTQPVGYILQAGDACPLDGQKVTPGNCGCGKTELSCMDCMGVPNGAAAIDVCGICSGGTSGVIPKTSIAQCIATSTQSALATNLKMYPNPTSDFSTIELIGSEFTVTIYSASGLELSRKEYSSTAMIGDGLPQGMYLIRIEQDGNVELRKLIKQ